MSHWPIKRALRQIMVVTLALFVSFVGLSLSGFVLVVSANAKTHFIMDTAPKPLALYKFGPLSFGFVAYEILGTNSSGILLARCADQRVVPLAYFGRAPDRVFQWVPDICRPDFKIRPNQSNL